MNYVDKEPLVRETQECKELLLEAMRYHLMPEHRGSLTSYRTSHRQPEGTKPYLFAIGGGSLFAIHSECEVYNPRTDRWSFIASMNTRRSRTAVATVGNLLYAVGGFDSTNDLASAECFNPQINKVITIKQSTLITFPLYLLHFFIVDRNHSDGHKAVMSRSLYPGWTYLLLWRL